MTTTNNAGRESQAEGIGLAMLRGTERQVTWANDIRVGAYNRLLVWLPANTACLPEIQDRASAARLIVNVVDNASWWIDNRDIRGSNMLCRTLWTTHRAQLRSALAEYQDAQSN